MNKFGTLQRRWSEQKPSTYDKETRTVYLDIQPEKGTRMGGSGEESEPVDGYSYCQVQIDPLIDYGHIKSQLIEAGFAQKDEFGLLMNAVQGIIGGLEVLAEDNPDVRDILASEDILAFVDFCEYRKMCADAAKEIVKLHQINQD